MVPLINDPLAKFNVPAPENTILESRPADVRLPVPVTVTVPVEISIWVKVPTLVPCKTTDPAEKVPAPTLIWFSPPAPGKGNVTAPLAVNDAVASARFIEDVAVVATAKVMLVQASARPLATVTVMPLLMVTVSAATGNDKPPQVAVLFQLPDTLATLAAASTLLVVSMDNAKIAQAHDVQRISFEADFIRLKFERITAPSLIRVLYVLMTWKSRENAYK